MANIELIVSGKLDVKNGAISLWCVITKNNAIRIAMVAWTRSLLAFTAPMLPVYEQDTGFNSLCSRSRAMKFHSLNKPRFYYGEKP